MTARELVDGLRELADRVEPHIDDFGDARFDPHLWVHCYSNRLAVLTAARIVESPQADHSDGHHWIKGMVAGIQLSAHYAAGLLGETRRESVKEVVIEDTPDIAALLAEEVAHAV